MKKRIALCLAATLLAAAGSAYATGPRKPAKVQASHAWIRLLPGTLPAGGYVTLHNAGHVALALTGAESPDYQSVMLHRSTLENGMSHMRMVKQLKLPAHANVTLAPGGYHLMLMHATHPINVGDMVPVTLQFADGSQLKVQFKARPANAQ